MHRRFFVFFLLAATQIIGWGAVGILPVLATKIAVDLEIALPTVFLGTSMMFVAMGLAAPFAGRGFRCFGARRVMAAGAALTGLSLSVIALAPGSAVFLGGWMLTGLAGAMFLTTAAYVYLADYAGDRARSLIGSLMLVTGLAGSVFWPVTASLDSLVGWRDTVLLYAVVMTLGVCPALFLGLPETNSSGGPSNEPPDRKPAFNLTFLLVILAIALNSFVTFGIEAIGIELFRALGTDMAKAVAIASLLGIFKVSGRVIDLLGGRNWDGLATAICSGALLPIGLAVVALCGISFLGIAGYLCLFGLGSGAFAVARATMPLVFFQKSGYATAMSAITLPMNLINALAPPALAGLLARTGPAEVLTLLSVLSAAAFAVLLWLGRLRSKSTVSNHSIQQDT